MKFSANEIAQVTNGAVHGPDVEIDGATQDSRAILEGQLFIPLVADRDGHDFIASAVGLGAAAYLTHEPPADGAGATAIVVEDTMLALRQLGRASRDRIDGPVAGITGSVGKTSTKDLLVSVLGQTSRAHASLKSFNNEIGVPLTLLNAPDGVEAAVVEMGARGQGHIASLCEVAQPDIGIVTTVAAAHTSEFGSVEAIALAKGELIESLPSSGVAVLNGDNPLVLGMAGRTHARVVTFGTAKTCDVVVSSIEVDDDLRATFTITSDWGTVVARPSTRGAHMATNVAAAVATAHWLEVPISDIEVGLAEAPMSPWRMEVEKSATGALIINDSYNANPTSMRGALASLERLPQARKIAVLGYMGELGPSEAEDHRSIAAEVERIGAELIAVGTDLYGIDAVDDPVAAIGGIDHETAILVKGSRSAGLESIAGKLLPLSSG